MDRAQRQRIADAVCEEWEKSQGVLESNTLYERLVGEGEQLRNSDLLDFLDELQEANLISQHQHIGSRRIQDVAPALCEEPLNY